MNDANAAHETTPITCFETLYIWICTKHRQTHSDHFIKLGISFSDAKSTFHLYLKKGTEEVGTKDLDQLFKAMALHIDDEKLKDWADEMDEEGKKGVHTNTNTKDWTDTFYKTRGLEMCALLLK